MANEKSEFPIPKNEQVEPDKPRAVWERPALRRLLTKEAQMPSVGKVNENNDGS